MTEEAAVAELQAAVEEVYVDPLLRRWIVELVRATRTLEFVELGASVRGSLALERAARALAADRTAATTRSPTTSSGSSRRSSRTGSCSTPEFLAEEEPTPEEVARRVWEGCLAAAPRPAPAEWEQARAAARPAAR